MIFSLAFGIIDRVVQKKCFPVAAAMEDIADDDIANFYEIGEKKKKKKE